jgi:cardiolipin synthase
MQARHIPNIISVLRIILVPFVLWQLWQQHYLAALALFTVAALSDGLDGILARHYGWTSRLGSVLDPLADKFLQVSSYIMLAWIGQLPWWLAAAVLGRDVVIIAGAMAYHTLIGEYEMHPSLLSKANTLLQIVLAVVVIIHAGVQAIPLWLLWTLIYIVLLSTVSSGVHYVITWTLNYRRYSEHKRSKS